MLTKNIAILGSTGSIGKQTLQVAEWYPERFKVSALTAKNDYVNLEKQCRRYNPKLAVLFNYDGAKILKEKLKDTKIKVAFGIEGLIEAATLPENDIVVTALSGAIGIKPTLAAIKLQKRIALANKETLVAAGNIVMREATINQVEIIPVDSEHSAIYQCFGHGKNVSKVILTASGGPFRGKLRYELENIKKETALKHPNWVMGAKITIDSATLMNKGLEVIEAYHLFNIPSENIEVVVHPESIIHSMVEYGDGSIFAHLGKPDMRIPIQYALSYPERISNNLERLNLTQISKLTFEKPDTETFKALPLAYHALAKGGVAPAVLNAANEELVHAFLNDKCSFLQITDITEEILERSPQIINPTLDEIFEADIWARNEVRLRISR